MSSVKIIDNTIHSAKIVLYKTGGGRTLFFILSEPEGIYGLPGGAQDEEDSSILITVRRELKEELGIAEKSYSMVETNITHEFIHTDKKSPRYGKKGILHVFLAQYNGAEQILVGDDLLGGEWVEQEEASERLLNSYDYLQGIFIQATALI